jgi:hypothetical protein
LIKDAYPNTFSVKKMIGSRMQYPRHLSVLMILSALCASCAKTTPPLRIDTPFEDSIARKLLQPGKNQINGQVRFEMPNGTLVSCVGLEVNLVPATRYAREWVRLFYGLDNSQNGSINSAFKLDTKNNEVKFSGANQFYAVTRSTTCDEDGEFTFDKVADGEFFVIAKIRWLGRDHEYYDFMYGIENAQELDGSVMEKVSPNVGMPIVNIQWKPKSPILLDGEGL